MPDSLPTSPRATLGHLVFTFVTVLMTALAAGAVWSLAAQLAHGSASWFSLTSGLASWLALPSGVAVALVLRLHRLSGSIGAAICAALFTALAIVYANYLMAAAQIARVLGIDLFPSFTDIGPEMVLALMQTTAGIADVVLWLVGMFLAVVLVARLPRQLAQTQ